MSHPTIPPSSGAQPGSPLPPDFNTYSLPLKLATVARLLTLALPQSVINFAYSRLEGVHQHIHQQVAGPVQDIANRVFQWTEERVGADEAQWLRAIVDEAMDQWNSLHPSCEDLSNGHQVSCPSLEMLTALGVETIIEVALLALGKVGMMAYSAFQYVRDSSLMESAEPITERVRSVADGLLTSAIGTVKAFGFQPIKDIAKGASDLVESRVIQPAIGALEFLRRTLSRPNPVPAD